MLISRLYSDIGFQRTPPLAFGRTMLESALKGRAYSVHVAYTYDINFFKGIRGLF